MSDKKIKVLFLSAMALFAVLLLGLSALIHEEEPVPAPGKEVYNWAPAPMFAVFYGGKLYDDPESWGGIRTVPKNAKLVGALSEITDAPDSELECSLGEVGAQVYLWEEDGAVLLGYEVDYPYDTRANTIAISGTLQEDSEDGFIVVY